MSAALPTVPISARVTLSKRKTITKAAKTANQSVAQWVGDAIDEKLERSLYTP